MPFVVRRETGQYLGRGTGARRSWVTDLDDADTFKTPGRAKVSFNHVAAPIKRRNEQGEHFASYRGRPYTPEPLPTFEAVEVRTVLVAE